MDAIVLAVAHDKFMSLTNQDFDAMFNDKNKQKIIIDVKGVLDKNEYTDLGYTYWRL